MLLKINQQQILETIDDKKIINFEVKNWTKIEQTFGHTKIYQEFLFVTLTKRSFGSVANTHDPNLYIAQLQSIEKATILKIVQLNNKLDQTRLFKKFLLTAKKLSKLFKTN